MNIKTTLSATEARQDFFNILSKVEKTSVPFTITINGEPKAVIMNAEEYEGWLETMEIISDPELVKGIEESKKELREGKYYTFEQVFGRTPEAVLRDQGKKKYSSKNKK